MLTIGKLSKTAGVKVPTIRYYEEIGLLPEAERSAGNQRLYGTVTMDRLTFIRHARDLGLTIDAIRELIELSQHPERPCHDADRIAAEQLSTVRRKIERLRRGDINDMQATFQRPLLRQRTFARTGSTDDQFSHAAILARRV